MPTVPCNNAWGLGNTRCVEPGRSLTANAGLLLTQVEYLKTAQDGDKGFAVVDAAMNDLLRPSLYQAWHDILVVDQSSNTAYANLGCSGAYLRVCRFF